MCLWEDDAVQAGDSSIEGGANKMSLSTARKNYLEFGAVEKAVVSMVRKPLPSEIP